MGFFDLFKKTKSPKITQPSQPVSAPAREQKQPTIPQRPTHESQSSPVIISKQENVAISSSNSNSTEHQKKLIKLIRFSDRAEIEKFICLEKKPKKVMMTFYCPIRYAKIYCHSVLIDKMGDLTKFILRSLYKRYTIEEICALTNMGNITVREELDYLIRGGLITENQYTLTKLGEQYGKLLEIFDTLSDGIDVAFNTFADKFEPIEEEKYVEKPDPKFILENNFIPILARNDDYRNSLEIAQKKINTDIPFCNEIIESLYATVKIERVDAKYKKVSVKDFNSGYISENGPCVKIEVPWDRISYRPRYKCLDKYRGIIEKIVEIDENFPYLLSDEARKILDIIQEENDADLLIRDINTITGSVYRVQDGLVELSDDQLGNAVERQSVQLVFSEETCNRYYLEEIKRERLYRIQYYPYNKMEM